MAPRSTRADGGDRAAAGHRRQPDAGRLAPHVRTARGSACAEADFLPSLRPARRRRQRGRGSGLSRQRAGHSGRQRRASRAACPQLNTVHRLRPVRRRHRDRPVRRRQPGLDGLILVNPWLVEAEADEPPPAAIRRHYRKRCSAWRAGRKFFQVQWITGNCCRGIRKIAPRDEVALRSRRRRRSACTRVACRRS